MTGTKLWRLWVEIKAEPEDRGREYVYGGLGQTDEQGNRVGWYHVYDSSGAQGTYIEVENTGDVLTFPADFVVWVEESTHTAHRIENGVLTSGATEVRQGFTMTHTDGERPIVLLAVDGGNQVFDHWETSGPPDTWVVSGQGARSEWPEPPPDSDLQPDSDPATAYDKYVGLYARAVFRKKPKDPRTGPLTSGQQTHRLPRDIPRP